LQLVQSPKHPSLHHRFIEQPRATITSRHKSQEATLGDDVGNLTKKAKYYEKKMEEANGQLRDIVSVS
jgi:prefoldin subunit 1